MTVNVRSLADFKRFLAEPGATLQIIQNDWMNPEKTSHPIAAKPNYFEPRQVARLQSNTVMFTSGGWLRFPKAKHARFDGDTVTLCMNDDGTFKHVLVYKLTKP